MAGGPGGEALLAAARALRPAIEAGGAQAERDRRLPPDLVRALARAGLFRMLLPRSLGGAEADPLTWCRVLEEVAAADGAVGWCLLIGAGTAAAVAARLPDDAVAAGVFGPDPDAVVGGTIAPVGRAVAVDGGYRVSGRWPFASGCQHCAWLAAGCTVYDAAAEAPRSDAAGRPETRLMLLPAGTWEVLDTWHAVGLRGSGSHDFAVRDAFVPAAHALATGPIPAARRRPGPAWAAPFFLVGSGAHALGVAQRALDALVALAAAKPQRGAPGGPAAPIRELARVQTQVARAEALVGAARAYLLERVGDAWRTACAGEDLAPGQRARIRLAMTHAVRSAARAVDLAYEIAGGTAVYAASPLERCFRDIHAATQHALVGVDSDEAPGRVLLGLAPGPAPFL